MTEKEYMLDRIIKGLLVIVFSFAAIAGMVFCYIGMKIIQISVSDAMGLKIFIGVMTIGVITIVIGALVAIACSIFLLQTIKNNKSL